jgi:hypothetical protein
VVVLRHGMSESGCVETGCQKVVVLRHGMSESGCVETQDVRKWSW